VSFASPLFLWFFLPLVLLAVVALPRTWRNGVVAVASLVFYATGAGSTTLLLLGCMVVNFVAGRAVEPDEWSSDARRRRALSGVVVFDLLVLGVWKYAGFATQQAATVSHWFGLDLGTASLVLPIGISFYTFHHISYVVDVYRGLRPALREPVAFIAYIAMFPQLIAGPIVRYHEIADQLQQVRTHRLDDVAAGFPRFALGLVKKVVVADPIAPIANACFSTAPADMTTGVAWLGAVAYTLQLYFDFSGYSDMAIGLGRMLGFRLPENFDRPYSAVTITDFWRRWHMSLSRWFRDYLYIPLGGNRGGTARTYRNLVVVFLLTGLWHGAAWTFVLWGAFHGTLLVLERVTGTGAVPTSRARAALRRVGTLLLVVAGWVLFRSPDLATAGSVLSSLVVPDPGGLTDAVSASVTHQRALVLVLAATVVLLPRWRSTGRFVAADRGRPAGALRLGLMTVGVGYAAVLVAAGTFSPFLYFRF
jgi:alginate O-acetyltransferase complex protein AlgI